MLEHNQDVVTNKITQLNKITDGKDQNKVWGQPALKREKRSMWGETRRKARRKGI